MHEVKTFEIRDHGTFIAAVAVKFDPVSGDERPDWLFRRGGWSPDCPPIVLMHLGSQESQADPERWRSPRTMPTAHNHMYEHWDSLHDGELIDVRVLLKESEEPCESEIELGG